MGAIIVNTVTTNVNNAIVLFASPHKNSFTAKLTNQLIDKLGENIDIIEYINIFDTKILPCIDCKACIKGECPYNSDGMDNIISQVGKANIIICALPVYFNGVPAPFKAIIDRCQQLYAKKVIQKRPVFSGKRLGILLTTAGGKDDKVTDAIYEIFKMVFSCFSCEFAEHIAFIGTDTSDEYIINEKQIKNIRHLIENIEMEEI